MRGVNKVILLGTSGDEPTYRQTNNGTAVANISLCTNDTYKDNSGQTVTSSEWHRLVFWGRLADIAHQYIHKGTNLYVEGKIQTRSYEDKEGNKRSVTEIVVSELNLLPSGSGNNAGAQNNQNYGNQQNYGNNGSYGKSNTNSFNNAQSANQMQQRSYQPQMAQNQPTNNFNNQQSFSNSLNSNAPVSDDLPF
ncbi:single-stranded DNA-binding protein [Succinivibrio dextrinosolvens]|uniref:single-stranded DNA-binding protein n=1 Tax=Succinivibrio dextrinosolvens TaxID=83771 RepID=UPI00241E56F7|nr:single-stranded DNA-binding protein [Succinivibrio dextrinosolvens]MBE6424273.1 single-stranded DNA-binding protein [Succinivibrio dextrinosolvens]